MGSSLASRFSSNHEIHLVSRVLQRGIVLLKIVIDTNVIILVLVLEVAVAAECPYIVTFNQADFNGSETFGVQAIKPKAFLELIGDL